MEQTKFEIFVGIVLLVFSMNANAVAGQIDDCLVFSEQVTQLIEESFKNRGAIEGSEVKKLKLEYPNVQENRLQMYLATAGINWATSNGARSRVFEKTVDNCRKFR